MNDTLSAPAFYVLLAVTARGSYGYEIVQTVMDDTQGTMILATGTVYNILNRFCRQGIVEKYEVTDFRERISVRYRITPAGRRLIESESLRMERATALARYKLTGRIGF